MGCLCCAGNDFFSVQGFGDPTVCLSCGHPQKAHNQDLTEEE